jgi:hypothetical protein
MRIYCSKSWYLSTEADTSLFSLSAPSSQAHFDIYTGWHPFLRFADLLNL